MSLTCRVVQYSFELIFFSSELALSWVVTTLVPIIFLFFPVVYISYCSIFDEWYISVWSYRSVEFVIRRLSLLCRVSNRSGCSSRKYDYNHVQAFHVTVAREAINPCLAWTMVFFNRLLVQSRHDIVVTLSLCSNRSDVESSEFWFGCLRCFSFDFHVMWFCHY